MITGVTNHDQRRRFQAGAPDRMASDRYSHQAVRLRVGRHGHLRGSSTQHLHRWEQGCAWDVGATMVKLGRGSTCWVSYLLLGKLHLSDDSYICS